ncbi:distal membrane-arm assembly complex protein 2-like [Liolophura sinensis]|uniref:distal membrane-arm assembly complex protein 2-like n=1 Tax=Liolophura sinensis TaxID=3198878 RepID=UPI0031581556
MAAVIVRQGFSFFHRSLILNRQFLVATVCTSCSRQAKIFEQGLSVDVLASIQQDIDLSPKALHRWIINQKWNELKTEHRYDEEKVKAMGCDIAAAHFVVKHGGAVKFLGRDRWHWKTEERKSYLPQRFVEGLTVEAIDASNTTMMYSSFDNLANLPSLVYLKLSDCQYIDDWCLSRFHMFADTLHFLDISGCPRVTERGLATLHHLENLKGLKISNMTGVDNKELVMILMEEMLPYCHITGIDYVSREHLDSKCNDQLKSDEGNQKLHSPETDEISMDRPSPS